MVKEFFYDLHCHTLKSSDSPTKVKQIVRIARKRGLDGVAITDHNSTYKGPKSINGIQIIPGSEISLSKETHLLSYFIKTDISPGLSLRDAVLEIKKQGGYAVLAHPFRKGHGHLYNISDKKKIKEILKTIDGIEAVNASDSSEARKSAIKLKTENKDIDFFSTAGSDAHMAGQVGFGAIKTKERLSQENFKDVLLKAEPILTPYSAEFNKKTFFWRKKILKIIYFFKILRLNKLKNIFYLVFLRNYFRLINKGFSKIRFNFKKDI